MTQYGTWVSYSGNARLILTIILLVVAGGLVGAGILLRRPVRLPRPGFTLTVFMFAGWGLAGVAFLACLGVYWAQERHEHIAKAPPPDPIALWTLTSAVALVLVVCIVASPHTWRVRVPSAAIAAMGAAAIFELPFDLVIWTRIYPPPTGEQGRVATHYPANARPPSGRPEPPEASCPPTSRRPLRHHANHSGKNKLSAVTNARIFDTTFIAYGTGVDG